MNKCFAAALLSGLCSTGAYSQYDLTFDSATGELFMHIDGNIINYVIETKVDLFLEDEALTPTNHTPFVSFFYLNGEPIAPNGVSSSTPRYLGESNQSYNGPQSGTFSLGRVLPPGRVGACDFINLIEKATYVTDLGVPVSHFNVVYLGDCDDFILGDTDGDGDLDDADLATAFANYTGPVGDAGGKFRWLGDTDYDGDIDEADLSFSFANYTGPGAPSVSVPEPAGLALLGLGGLLFARRRRLVGF